MSTPTYRVLTYDVADHWGDDGRWTTEFTGVSLWGLRPILRHLYGRGYCNVSVLVEQEWEPAGAHAEANHLTRADDPAGVLS